MSTAAISSLPFQTGGAVAAGAGRLVLWVVAQYMRQPLRNTTLAGMIGLTSMAGSNALYFQTHHHPSPLFGVAEQQQVAEIADTETMAVPPPRPKSLKLPLPDATTTGSVETAVKTPAVSNDDVLKLQQKLIALQLLDSKADGLFGPRTARAIKAFEEKSGLPAKGQLTRDIVDRILSAALIVDVPKVEALPEPEPLPAAKAKVETTTLSVEPLPAPAPLAAIDTAAPAEAAKPAGRVIPGTPEEALNLVADTAHDALDTIIDGVQTMTMNSPPPVKRVVQTIAVKASTQAAPVQTASVESTPAATAVTQPLPAALPPANVVPEPVSNADMVASVQRGLASLGFLHGPIDGVAGEATAKAIRNFEVYYNYNVTGRVTPELVKLLVQNGAVI
ncbi:MAG TPA: peptidoglycan-binding domain-containing protein [Devosia sp.]|nr:peptidoglycan-binding domain-containing protein [Devosia sp.]